MLTTTRTKGVRKLANAQAPTIRADIAGIVDDIAAAAYPSGSALPSASADKWPGRSFWHTTEKTWYVCDGTTWLPVGGQQTIPLASFGEPAPGYEYDTAGGASYVYQSGRRIDVRLRVRRTSGVLSHGDYVFQTEVEFTPAGAGAWVLPAVQAGGAATASAVGASLTSSRLLIPLSPNGTSTTLEVNGSYYIP